MTGILETTPGPGHNTEGAEKENQHWERWAKKRTFVRALEGTYSHLYKQLIDQPRVFSSKDVSQPLSIAWSSVHMPTTSALHSSIVE